MRPILSATGTYNFMLAKWLDEKLKTKNQQGNVVSLILPFKDKKSADIVRRQLTGLGCLVGEALRPIFTSRRIRHDVKVQEEKPPLVNHQCVVYKFKCDLCDADYVGYTCRHLHQLLMNTRDQWYESKCVITMEKAHRGLKIAF